MKINKKIILSALFFTFSSVALESDYVEPIHVTSVTQHAKMKENTLIFSKNVELTQGSIKISADKLTVIRGSKAEEVMIAKGSPATFHQTQDDLKPLNAKANSIRYDIAKGKITLSGNAQIKQLDSEINGSEIIYFLETQELIVNTGSNKDDRVSTVFLPSQFKKTEDKTSDKKK